MRTDGQKSLHRAITLRSGPEVEQEINGNKNLQKENVIVVVVVVVIEVVVVVVVVVTVAVVRSMWKM
jgi:hypothetical protein